MKTITKVFIGLGLGAGVVLLLTTPEERLHFLAQITGSPIPKEGCLGPGCSPSPRPPSPIPIPQKEPAPGYAVPVGSTVAVKPLPDGFSGGDLVVTERFAPSGGPLDTLWSYRGKASFFSSMHPFIETDVLRSSRPASPI
jgi:hypothetical protein